MAFAEMVAKHYDDMLTFYGVDLGIRNARKHLDWYSGHLQQSPDFAPLRRSLLTCREPKQVLATVREIFENSPTPRVAA